MPRYIDADALQSNMMEMVASGLYGLEDMIDAVIEAPTVSPDEVRGVGKWEKDSDGLDICSECGEIALQRVFLKLPNKIVDLQMIRSNYCPNCGAKMEVSEDA